MFPEERLGSTVKNQSYPPTGTRPSPGSVSVWRPTNSSGSLSSTSRLTLCTHWSLMANTAPPHWVVTSGKSWLVPKAHYSTTATKKGSMPFVLGKDILKPELVLLATTRKTVSRATQGSDLAQEVSMTIQTRVVTRPWLIQIMETNTSKSWDTSWSNKYDLKNNIKLNCFYTDFPVSSATPWIGTCIRA